jgi:hypothetical protein
MFGSRPEQSYPVTVGVEPHETADIGIDEMPST